MSDLINRNHPPETDSTSLSLLDGIRANNPAYWQRLEYLYAPIVRGYCRALKIPEPDREDLTQEVLLAVYRSIHRFRREQIGQSFRAWLRRIAQNKAMDYYRAHKKSVPTLPLCTDPTAASSMDSELTPQEADGLLRRTLELIRDRVEKRTWISFWRVVIDSAPPAEVAEELGISVASVHTHKSRMIRRLRNELQGLEEDLLGS